MLVWEGDYSDLGLEVLKVKVDDDGGRAWKHVEYAV